jgi:hypothetical protein
MTLQNDTQLRNTRRKLAELQALLQRKEQPPPVNAAHQWAIEGLRRWERKLMDEIRQYEAMHQRA